MPFPATLDVEVLSRRHPEYKRRESDWERYEVLAEGGSRLKSQAQRFLTKKPTEPDDVYRARVERFTAENHLGTGLAWYGAALFANPLEFSHFPKNELGQPETEQELPANVAGFWTRFLSNSDLEGTTLQEYFREVFENLVTFQQCWLLIDRLPGLGPDGTDESRADSEKPERQPYLATYSPLSVTNWSEASGRFAFVVIETCRHEIDFVEGKQFEITEWTVYRPDEFATYEFRRDLNEKGRAGDKNVASLIRSGAHASSHLMTVPLIRLKVPNKFWLVDRAALVQQEHIDLDNTISWKLFIAHVAMLVIKSGQDMDAITKAEQAYLRLEQNDGAEYLEPGTESIQVAEERLSRKREQIFRSMHLQSQARDSSATAAVQSGFSKEMDLKPAMNVLESFGEVLGSMIAKVLDFVGRIMVHPPTVHTVKGFPEEAEDAREVADNHLRMKEMRIESDTLDKALKQEFGRRAHPTASPAEAEKIRQEIEKGTPLTKILEEEKAEREQVLAGTGV